ncbi:hypothetical protein BDW62DRAFT_204217 [Aspergillus aurantiobrunneus]
MAATVRYSGILLHHYHIDGGVANMPETWDDEEDGQPIPDEHVQSLIELVLSLCRCCFPEEDEEDLALALKALPTDEDQASSDGESDINGDDPDADAWEGTVAADVTADKNEESSQDQDHPAIKADAGDFIPDSDGDLAVAADESQGSSQDQPATNGAVSDAEAGNSAVDADAVTAGENEELSQDEPLLNADCTVSVPEAENPATETNVIATGDNINSLQYNINAPVFIPKADSPATDENAITAGDKIESSQDKPTLKADTAVFVPNQQHGAQGSAGNLSALALIPKEVYDNWSHRLRSEDIITMLELERYYQNRPAYPIPRRPYDLYIRPRDAWAPKFALNPFLVGLGVPISWPAITTYLNPKDRYHWVFRTKRRQIYEVVINILNYYGLTQWSYIDLCGRRPAIHPENFEEPEPHPEPRILIVMPIKGYYNPNLLLAMGDILRQMHYGRLKKNGKRGPFRLRLFRLRVEIIDPALVEAAEQAGCRQLRLGTGLGVESATQ